MKYLKEMQESLFYDFVFYETDKKFMYIYCPNCGSEHKIAITKTLKVKDIKETIIPCNCFSKKPKYLNSIYEYKKLNRVKHIGEFSNYNGIAVFTVYKILAEFGSEHYCCYRPFKRYPVYSEKPILKFTFMNNKVKMEGCLHEFMLSISYGEWRSYTRWSSCLFDCSVVNESLQELKGTELEQYKGAIEIYKEIFEERANVGETEYNELIIAWLKEIYSNNAAKRLWKAGYYNLVADRVAERIGASLYSSIYYGIPFQPTLNINWRGKTLDKIFKVKPSKLELIENRRDTRNMDVLATQRLSTLEKDNIEYTQQNAQIVLSPRYSDLHIFSKSIGMPISKVFKYIRNQSNKSKITIGSIVVDYTDYLSMQEKMKVPFTKDIAFPSNLKKAHDRTVEIYNLLADKIKNSDFKKAIQPYIDFSYKSNKYMIEVVKSATQLKNEAKKLHNCAAGYIDKVIKGKSVVFLVREKTHPKKAFYMAELNPVNMEIVQNRGMHNIDSTDSLRQFTDNWLNNIVRPRIKQCK